MWSAQPSLKQETRLLKAMYHEARGFSILCASHLANLTSSKLTSLKGALTRDAVLQDLVGRIADRGAEFVPAREWMRICFELLEMLKAHKKGIRRATVNTFGYIAKAIGPQDVLVTLLNNLKVQERQNRVCTTVAIAIVAETCSPFTVLPALMNEYKVTNFSFKTYRMNA